MLKAASDPPSSPAGEYGLDDLTNVDAGPTVLPRHERALVLALASRGRASGKRYQSYIVRRLKTDRPYVASAAAAPSGAGSRSSRPRQTCR